MTPDQVKEKRIVELRKLCDERFGEFSDILFSKSLTDLRTIGKELNIEGADDLDRPDIKTYLVFAIRELILGLGGYRYVEGRLEILPNGSGFLRDVHFAGPGLHSPMRDDNYDVYVPASIIKRFQLKESDIVASLRRWPYAGEEYLVLLDYYLEVKHAGRSANTADELAAGTTNATSSRRRRSENRQTKAHPADLGKQVAGKNANGDRTEGDRESPQPSAQLDQAFNGQGGTFISFGEPADCRALATQSDGRILVAGSVGSVKDAKRFAIARCDPDGSLDKTFGVKGKSIIAIGDTDNVAHALALQSDGKILLAGEALDPGDNRIDFALVRLDTNGIVDQTFNRQGFVFTDFVRGEDAGAYAVAVQDDEKILVAGYTVAPKTGEKSKSRRKGVLRNESFALARYQPNGVLDKTFGTGGRVVTSFPGDLARGRALCIQPDGKILLAGIVRGGETQGRWDFAAVRYDAKGKIDKSFGKNGRVLVDIAGTDNTCHAIALQSDGKIVLAGAAADQPSNTVHSLIVRLDDRGRLDKSFNRTGFARASEFLGAAHDVTICADGRILAAGYAILTKSDHGGPPQEFERFALVSYGSDGSVDRGFGSNGVLRIDLGGQSDRSAAINQLDDGKILVAGTSDTGKTRDFAVVRVAVKIRTLRNPYSTFSDRASESSIMPESDVSPAEPVQDHTEDSPTSQAEVGPPFDERAEAFAWILDVPEEAVRNELERLAVVWWAAFKRGVHLPIDTALDWTIVHIYRAIADQNIETRDAVREEHQAELVARMRADETKARLVALYDAANLPIATGDPPLTQEVANCYFDLVSFNRAMAAGTEWHPLPAHERARYTQILSSQYPELPREHREWLAGLPRGWTAWRAYWRNASEAERQRLRQELLAHGVNIPAFAQSFTPPEAAAPSEPAAVPTARDTSSGVQLSPGSGQQPAADSTKDTLLTEIMRGGAEKEAAAAKRGPEAALQARMANQALYAQVLTNIMQTRYDSLMAVARNLRA
jgi:uncharacterized delta-60 repeat protein